MFCESSLTFSLLVELHLAAWATACVCAFAVYYSYSEIRMNPQFDNQLHCLSGLIVFNKPLFGTLMCGLSGAVVLAVAGRVTSTCDSTALVLLMLMFLCMLLLVNYDIVQHHLIHFSAFAGLVIVGTLFVLYTDVTPMFLTYAYISVTVMFAGLISINASFTNWTPPFMTIQALNEILWVVVFGVYLFVYALGKNRGDY